MKFQLIEGWEKFWKMWSLRFTAAGTVLLGWIAQSPDILRDAWHSLPDEMRQYIPQNYLMYISLGLLALGMFSRVVKQEKLQDGTDQK